MPTRPLGPHPLLVHFLRLLAMVRPRRPPKLDPDDESLASATASSLQLNERVKECTKQVPVYVVVCGLYPGVYLDQ
ncbi:hypothetical protein A0H81_05773 [Grifola frondosa]|uniref:Uncharacterized protein n=1 Tax=Grifola frondosa TaxID=5627 RepID=A0A1C7MCS5_GRIFR|nr:hypothetical protein A0H81_05773 [Grifola frondosa]